MASLHENHPEPLLDLVAAGGREANQTHALKWARKEIEVGKKAKK